MSTVVEERQETEQLGPEHRRRAIEDKVLLLSPTVGQWAGRYKIPKERIELKIDGKDVNTSKKGVTTPQTVMITDNWPVDRDGTPWKKRISEILKIKDRIIRTYSISFKMAGARIVPKHKGVEFFSEMIGLTLGKLRRDLKHARDEDALDRVSILETRIEEVIRTTPYATDVTPVNDLAKTDSEQAFSYQWMKLADEFVADLDDRMDAEGLRGRAMYPIELNPETGEELTDDNDQPVRFPITQGDGILTQIERALNATAPGVWSLVQSRVPQDAAAMRAKFHSSIYPVELASGSSFSGVTADLLADYSDVVDQAMAAAVDGCIEEVIQRPREELCDAMANLQELISRDGRVRSSSFAPIYAAIEKLRLFQFACTDEMLDQLNVLTRRLDNTNPVGLNRVKAAEHGFTAALDSVIAEIENESQAEQDFQEFGKEFRGIDL